MIVNAHISKRKNEERKREDILNLLFLYKRKINEIKIKIVIFY